MKLTMKILKGDLLNSIAVQGLQVLAQQKSSPKLAPNSFSCQSPVVGHIPVEVPQFGCPKGALGAFRKLSVKAQLAFNAESGILLTVVPVWLGLGAEIN
jgi:hypothetical protein